MDPYLEAPGVWEPFHDRLIFHLGSVLQEVLPERYVADFRQRVDLVLADRQIVPDVVVARVPERASARESAAPGHPDPAIQIAAPFEEAVDRYIEVVHIPDREVVTVIELSSPTNKADWRGQKEYEGKQLSILRSDVHLIEIDRLRAGRHWPAVPEPLARRHGPYDYLVSTSRAPDRTVFWCYFRTVREPLPVIGVPLRPGDADATLDIQEAFNRAFDQGRYASWLRYDREPVPPLSPEDQAWAAERLREAGLPREPSAG